MYTQTTSPNLTYYKNKDIRQRKTENHEIDVSILSSRNSQFNITKLSKNIISPKSKLVSVPTITTTTATHITKQDIPFSSKISSQPSLRYQIDARHKGSFRANQNIFRASTYNKRMSQQKLSTMLSSQMPQIPMSTKQGQHNSTLWINKEPKYNSQQSPSKKFVYISPNQGEDKIFIVKAKFSDRRKIQCIQVNRDDLSGVSEDIYVQREVILKKIQADLAVGDSYKFLFLTNMKPIQFFEEIPEDCNLIFINSTPSIEFWHQLFRQHQAFANFNKINQLNTCLLNMSTLDQLKSFFNDSKCFRSVRTDNAFLTELNPSFNRTKAYYQVSEENEDLPLMSPLLDTPVESDDDGINKPKERDVDFSVVLHGPNSKMLDYLLKQNKLNKLNQKRPKSRVLQLTDYKTQCGNLIKQQNVRQRNMNKYFNVHRQISKDHPLLMGKNIQQWVERTGFTREEVHEIFSRYKALLGYECDNIPGITKQLIPHGLSFDTFYAGLDELSMAPFGVVHHLYTIFAKSNSLDFEGFLNAINLIRAKKIDDKIELILKLMDENENGLLSFSEIMDRCLLMMDQILKRDNSELSIDKMSEYITRSVFDAVTIHYSDEIPIEKIRNLIESNKPEAQVLIMMCCGDVNYLK